MSNGVLATGVASLEARNVSRSYMGGDGRELEVLRGVHLSVNPGEVVSIVGASGAGKSTLLNILGFLDRPTGGEVLVGGRSMDGLQGEELAEVRNRHIGFVFQFHHLLREFTALENVMMPALISGTDAPESERDALALLEAVGMSERLKHRPSQLSGGEQQRVAVARALMNRPMVLLADEPSGNLDIHSSERLHDLLFQLKEEAGLGMVLVTHNRELARRADRILKLEDGVLHESGTTDGG